jgi:hypothetical protein
MKLHLLTYGAKSFSLCNNGTMGTLNPPELIENSHIGEVIIETRNR